MLEIYYLDQQKDEKNFTVIVQLFIDFLLSSILARR